MIKRKVAELEGALLDWAVATITLKPHHHDFDRCFIVSEYGAGWMDARVRNGGIRHYQPSTDWAVGGPLLDHYRPHFTPQDGNGYFAGDKVSGPRWLARMPSAAFNEMGPTMLMAGMRAIVAHHHGVEMEVPHVVA